MIRPFSKHRHQRGIGLLELMLSLAIIAILLVMATRYFLVASTNEKVNSTINTIGGIQGAVTCWKNSRGTLQDATLTNMDSIGCLPSQLWVKDTETVVNPWGPAITWTPSETNIPMEFKNIPAKACKNLTMKYDNDDDFTANCPASGDGTITYIIR